MLFILFVSILISQCICLSARILPVLDPNPNLYSLKKYFIRFGYISSLHYSNVSNESLKSAIVKYQTKLGLPVTGNLDSDTISVIKSPRCGNTDDVFHAKQNYAYFPGKPRWTHDAPMNLTYAFSPTNFLTSLPISDVRAVFTRAFNKWATVIPLTFTETDEYDFADIRIGFFNGDHGDGEPFDGVLGVLAHSFTPESGRLHLDEAETWAVDFEKEKSSVAVDLESVAIHEIGHVLGLSHSSVKEAVMYPTLKPRAKKLELSVDDVNGVQALYGSNPNFKMSSVLESDILANFGVGLTSFGSVYWVSMLSVFLCYS